MSYLFTSFLNFKKMLQENAIMRSIMIAGVAGE